MRTFLTLLILVCSFSLWAQPGNVPQKEVNGVMVYIHTVEAGNSLWGLQRVYGVKIEELVKLNPGLTEELTLGQEILIPVFNPDLTKLETIDYKVKKGETLYRLSRKLEVSLDALIALNPELSEGLKRGQILKVPKNKEISTVQDVPVEDVPNPFASDVTSQTQENVSAVFNDSIVMHTVRENETMYSISRRFMVPIETIIEQNNLSGTQLKEGEVLKILLKRERIEKVMIKAVPIAGGEINTVESEKKDSYRIAVLLPFFLDKGPGYSKNVSDLATQFYMGAALAIDTLEAMGLNAEVCFYDTRNDTNTVKDLLSGSLFKPVDLIIGPFFPTQQKIVAEYCSVNEVKMIVPVSSDVRLLEGKKMMHASVPSQITLVQGVADYILNTCEEDNIILVKPMKKSDWVYYETFRDRFNQERNISQSGPVLIETTVDEMKIHLTTSKKNVLVFPVVTKSSAIAFMDRLNSSSFRAKMGDIKVFGMKEWVDFTEINNLYKNKFNMHFGSSNFVDYNSEPVIEVNRKFRLNYQTDMSKMAIQAYDVFMFYCSSFLFEQGAPNLLMNHFRMEPVGAADGYENKNVFIVEQREYELFDAETRGND